MAGELRACAAREAEIQAQLRGAGEAVTGAEVAAQRLRDQAAEAEQELAGAVARSARSWRPRRAPTQARAGSMRGAGRGAERARASG